MVNKEDLNSFIESLYLASIPGMYESIIEGLIQNLKIVKKLSGINNIYSGWINVQLRFCITNWVMAYMIIYEIKRNKMLKLFNVIIIYDDFSNDDILKYRAAENEMK